MSLFFCFVSSGLACIFIAGCGGGGGSKGNNVSSQSNSSIAVSTYQTITINASQLANNLLAESTQRQIQVYLPKAYFTSNASFPVVYLLPGYGGNRLLENPQQDFDTAFNTDQPAIMVNISGINLLGGSFFVDSTVTGKWADYVIKDAGMGYMNFWHL